MRAAITSRAGRRRPAPQRGSAAVQFALVSMIFFGFVFGTMELARALYLWNTLTQVVSRAARGAALANPADAAALDLVRQQAMFLDGPGNLLLGGDIDDSYLRVEYLAADLATPVTPAPCPLQNLINCTEDPGGATCIRFVRVRLCMPGTCAPVPYQPMGGFDALAGFHINIPPFTTVVPAQTLGLPSSCTP